MKELFIVLDDVLQKDRLAVVQRIMDKAESLGYTNLYSHTAESLLDCMSEYDVIALYKEGYFCASSRYIAGNRRSPIINAYKFLKNNGIGFTLEPEFLPVRKSTSSDDAWYKLAKDALKKVGTEVNKFKFDMSWIRGEARVELMRVIVKKLYDIGVLEGHQWANMGLPYHTVSNGKLSSYNRFVPWDLISYKEVSINSILRGESPKENVAYKIDLSMYPDATREVVREAILKVAYEKGYKWACNGAAPTKNFYSLYLKKSKQITCSVLKETYKGVRTYTPLSVEDALEGKY